MMTYIILFSDSTPHATDDQTLTIVLPLILTGLMLINVCLACCLLCKSPSPEFIMSNSKA